MGIEHNISNEIRDIAPTIANLGNHTPYALPAGYFDSLAANILGAIKRYSAYKYSQVFEVPSDYFESLATNILKKIHQENQPRLESNEVHNELLEIAPLLAGLDKKNVFSVPADYFENLSFGYNPKKSAKVISIRSSIRRWATYAAAASVLFILSTTSYLYVNHHLHNIDKSPTIEQRLADLDDTEIINYLKYDQETTGDLIPSVSDQDPDINHLLINASDDEIKNYLDEENDASEKNIKGI